MEYRPCPTIPPFFLNVNVLRKTPKKGILELSMIVEENIMYQFQNEHAKKAIRLYGLTTILGILLLAAIAIPIMLGMNKVNAIFNGDVFYEEYYGMSKLGMFIDIARTETFFVVLLWVSALIALAHGVGGTIMMHHFIRTHGGKSFVHTLEKEMNLSTATWLEKSKVYVTENYIISFKNGFVALLASDIVWIYRSEHSLNSVPTHVTLKVLCSNGKKYEMANVAPNQYDTEYPIITGTVLEKNPDVLVGYSTETMKAAKNLMKKIKKRKRNK